MKISILATILALSLAAQCQTVAKYMQHVTVTGNSIAHFQAPFGPYEFPGVQQSGIYIWGQDGFTCADVEQEILGLVPAATDVLVLIDSTNDIRTMVLVADHMACIQSTITMLLARNPALKIVVANTPPWTQYNPCAGAFRNPDVVALIEAYNAAYADPVTGLQAQWPNNVRVADVFTPSAGPNGWAIPADMMGPCGIHPDEEFVWSPAWAHFAGPYESLVMQTLAGQW